MVSLKLSNISHSFGSHRVVEAIDLVVQPNEIVGLVGLSGSGKTTLLNICAGLIQPSDGLVQIDGGAPSSSKNGTLGYVFQHPALVPWKTVQQNILLPIALSGGSVNDEDDRLCNELIEEFGLSGFENSYPRELSGGMKRRVGVARGLITRPSLLFMDEPFGELDEVTRREMISHLLTKIKSDGASALLVTHSIDEAVLLSDRVLCLGASPSRIVLEQPTCRPETLDPEFGLSLEQLEAARNIFEALRRSRK